MNKQLFELADIGTFLPIPCDSKTTYKNYRAWWINAERDAHSLGEGNCPYCKGKKKVECSECYGFGECVYCSDGWANCTKCDGGKVNLYRIGELTGTPESIFNQLVYGSIYKPEVTVTIRFRRGNDTI